MWTMSKFDSTEGLKFSMVKKLFPRYIKIIKENLPAKFEIAKRIVFDFDNNMSTKTMWEEHEKLVQKLDQTQLLIDKGKMEIDEIEIPRFSLLDLKIMLAEDMMKSCRLCEHRCSVNRLSGEIGKCRVGKDCIISSEFIHKGEEAHISPSHTIFFMGCNLNCQFCQNWTISRWYEKGVDSHPFLLARAIRKRKSEGARNVNWVGGEPTPQIVQILKTLKRVYINTPQIWNSNFYMSEKTMKLLEGIVDMYLSDFKYGNNECAKHLSKIDNYFDVCSRNHKIASDQAEMTIRHLVLPNHVECCTKPVLKWIAENLRTRAMVNIMDQYKPCYKALEYTDIKQEVTEDEMKEAVSYAKKLRLNYVS